MSATASLGVLLLHSTDAPERVVCALRALAAAAGGGRAPVLVLDAEGVRVGARGVLETLHGDGRPDCRALLEAALAAGARVHVVREAWRERGYADDALVAGAALDGAERLAALAADGRVFVSY